MMYYDQARKLALKLYLYQPYKEKNRTILDKEIFEESPELEWTASIFCAKVLINSKQQQFHTLSRSDLTIIQKDFKAATGKIIDIEKLFSKGWLCEVFRIIASPSAVKAVAKRTLEIAGLGNEYHFFDAVKVSLAADKKKITTEELADLAKSYIADNNCSIDLEKARSHFWHEKEGQVEITLHPVYKSIFQYIDDFLFIAAVIDATRERCIYIEKSTLSVIHSNHAFYFPNTPSLEELIDSQVFRVLSDGVTYQVNLRFNEFSQLNSCADRYAALLWNYLLLDDTFSDDNDRLSFWYSRLVYGEEYINIDDFFYGEPKARFIAAAMQVVISDTDSKKDFAEYSKMRLDELHARLDHFQMVIRLDPNQDYFSLSDDPFEIFERLMQLEKATGDEMIALMGTRRPLSYFISQIVKNDSPHQFTNTIELLKIGHIKPFVFYSACFNVYYWNPHIIPFLAHHSSLSSLSFQLLLKIGISSFTGSEAKAIYPSLLKEQFALITENCASNNDIKIEEKAKIVFQCLLKATAKKFKIRGNERAYRMDEKRKNLDLSKSIRDTFEKTMLGTVHHIGSKRFQLPLYSKILEALLVNVKGYEHYDNYKRGDLHMPFIKFDLLNYLLVLAAEEPTSVQTEDSKQFIINICSAFSDIYVAVFNIDNTFCLDYDDNTLKSGIPSWRSQYTNEEILDISQLLLHFEDNDLLDDFLSDIRFRFSAEKNQHDDFNRFTAERLRTHLHVLLRAYNTLYRKININTMGLPIARVSDKLESQITSLVKRHCVFMPAKRRYNIFNIYLERYFTEEQEQLLPVIGMVLNKFKVQNRKLIVDELIGTDQIVRALQLLDYIVSENESRILFKSITKIDIKSTMEKLEYMDLHYVVGKLLIEPAFVKSAEKALAIAEKRLTKLASGSDKQSNLLFIFRNKLLLVYQKGGTKAIEEIDALNDPRPNTAGRKGNSTEAEKDFYRALIYFNQDEGEKAYNTYNKLLSYGDGEKPVLALNRFASKLKWAKSSQEQSIGKKLYREALDEWIAFEETKKKEEQWQNISENVLYNKLQATDGLGDSIEFDNYYNSLENEMQLRRDFLSIRVNNLTKRDMIVQADAILAKAKEYHKLETGEVPEFIYDLIELTRPAETIEYFKEQYLRIFNNAPDQLVKIIPDNLNIGKSLHLFLLHEIVGSANDMLRLINGISTVNYEDKLTDLILLALNGRVRNYHWYATTDRGGFAHADDDKKGAKTDARSPNPGEIDFSIFSAGKEKLATAEALIVEGKNTTEVQKHVLKIFNYDHGRKLFYIVVYYKGKTENYKKAWDSYKSVVDDFIEFPAGYAIVGGSVGEITGYGENDSLKIGQTAHENGTVIYHIFMNINYKLELTERMVKDKT